MPPKKVSKRQLEKDAQRRKFAEMQRSFLQFLSPTASDEGASAALNESAALSTVARSAESDKRTQIDTTRSAKNKDMDCSADDVCPARKDVDPATKAADIIQQSNLTIHGCTLGMLSSQAVPPLNLFIRRVRNQALVSTLRLALVANGGYPYRPGHATVLPEDNAISQCFQCEEEWMFRPCNQNQAAAWTPFHPLLAQLIEAESHRLGNARNGLPSAHSVATHLVVERGAVDGAAPDSPKHVLDLTRLVMHSVCPPHSELVTCALKRRLRLVPTRN